MAKLEIPVIVDCTEIDKLIDEIKHLQTYKLFEGDEQVLITRDDTLEIFVKHIKASALPKRKVGKWIKISWAGIYECSECGQNVMTSDIDCYKWCHGCGAKMEKSDG